MRARTVIDHGGEEPVRGPRSVPGGEHRGHDRDREPGGGLQVARDAQGDPRTRGPRSGGLRSRRDGTQGQREQHEREYGRIGGDHGQVEAYHRRGDRDPRGEQGVTAGGRHRDPEGDREHGHRAQGEPHPGVPGQAADTGRGRQAEQGHDRQVGVVGQPVGDLICAQVRRAVVQQQGRRPLDDHHPVFERVGDGQPEQRGEHGEGHRHQHRHGPVSPPPEHEQGHGVAADRPDGPNLVLACRSDRVDRGVGEKQDVGDDQVAAIQPGPKPGTGLACGQSPGRDERAHSATRSCVVHVHVPLQLVPR